MMPNGIVVTTSGNDTGATFNLKTAQGDFSFRAADIPWGLGKEYLQGRVVINRVPTMARLTDSTEEQDFPALAQADDSVYVTYTEFVHSDRFPKKAAAGH